MEIITGVKVSVDRSGQRFGRLVAQEPVKVVGKKGIYYRCVCDCGGEAVKPYGGLTMGRSQSCGCLRTECARANFKKATEAITLHGMSGTPEHSSYKSAKARCNSPSTKGYAEYGGRGIEFRFKSFNQFYKELGSKPTPAHSVDRIKTNGHYEPGNVRWSTPKEQSLNRRDNRHAAAFGKWQTMSEWATQYGIDDSTLYKRLNSMTLEQALTMPVKEQNSHDPVTIGEETKSVSEWCKVSGVKLATAYLRIHRGWPVELAVTAPKNSRYRGLTTRKHKP